MHKYKKTLVSVALSCFGWVGLHASPLVTLSDSVYVSFVGHTAFEYDSNIFLNYSNSEGDLIHIFEPGLKLFAGGESEYDISLTVAEQFKYYFDHDDLKQANEIIRLSGNYDSGGKLTAGVSGGYRTVAQNTNTANVSGALIRRRNYDLGFTASYKVSPKTQLEFNPHWRQEDYRNFTSIFNDRDVYVLPFNAYYLFSPKFKFGGGYRFQYTDLHANDFPGNRVADLSSHYFSLRSDGEIGPKLTNITHLGWQFQHTNGSDTINSMAMSSSLVWEATQRVKLTAGINRDFNVSGVGSSIIETGGNFAVNYIITEKLSTVTGLSYSVSDYKTRAQKDEIFGYYWNLNYALNKYFRFGAGYSYQNNDSESEFFGITTSASSYKVHRFNISANVEY